MPNPPLWKASIALTRAEAADMAATLELASEPQAVLIAEEPFEDAALVEALYTEEPDAAFLSSVAGRAVTVAPLPDQDWIRLSQEGLPPVRAGRFFVYGAHDAGQVPHGVIPVKIEAGLAFGTGHHETTALCLSVLSDLARGQAAFHNVLDLGTGTGLLAIGAAKLWKKKVLASDIDPVAVEVTRENARANGVGPLVLAVTADGLDNPLLKNGAPYDLIIANILAGPLTKLAPAIIRALAPGGTLVLSGLLRNQELLVTSFYKQLRFAGRRRMGPWSALVLEKA
jgi:ribosomal protein L11 methyltransferase